jgi:hypothetical protein
MTLQIQKGGIRGPNFLYYLQEITAFLGAKNSPTVRVAGILLPHLRSQSSPSMAPEGHHDFSRDIATTSLSHSKKAATNLHQWYEPRTGHDSDGIHRQWLIESNKHDNVLYAQPTILEKRIEV